ncbi:hypothetical protein CPB86DRAFT_163193 [Serendipita vermifera]|nr:hypothetical protein CPB86DRAFT_163193 [Serendipita vermifera]
MVYKGLRQSEKTKHNLKPLLPSSPLPPSRSELIFDQQLRPRANPCATTVNNTFISTSSANMSSASSTSSAAFHLVLSPEDLCDVPGCWSCNAMRVEFETLNNAYSTESATTDTDEPITDASSFGGRTEDDLSSDYYCPSWVLDMDADMDEAFILVQVPDQTASLNRQSSLTQVPHKKKCLRRSRRKQLATDPKEQDSKSIRPSHVPSKVPPKKALPTSQTTPRPDKHGLNIHAMPFVPLAMRGAGTFQPPSPMTRKSHKVQIRDPSRLPSDNQSLMSLKVTATPTLNDLELVKMLEEYCLV